MRTMNDGYRNGVNWMDLICNALIFLITTTATVRFFHKDGTWAFSHGKKAFRYFTVLSNLLCALAALLMCFASAQPWVWLLKYVGTVAVTVTMLTVFVFLAPTMGSLRDLLKGSDLFMHLITPLLALASFCVLEKRGLAFRPALLALIPVAVYGLVYLYQVLLAPEGRRWKDFYGFNKGGRWPLSVVGIMGGCFAVCMALMALQNL